MEPWHWAIVFKPFFLLGYLFAVAVIAVWLRYVWPEWALKQVLFDRTFRDRHPAAYTLIAFGLFFGVIIAIGVAGRLLGLDP